MSGERRELVLVGLCRIPLLGFVALLAMIPEEGEDSLEQDDRQEDDGSRDEDLD